MKLEKLILSLGLAALASVAQAQTIPALPSLASENDGDLVLGFTNSGASKDLLVDVGPANDYFTSATALAATGNASNGSLTAGTTYTVAAYNAADLTTALGASNAVSTSTLWTVFGGNGTTGNAPVSTTPIQTLWLSAPSTTTVVSRPTAGQQGLSQNIDGLTNTLAGAGMASPDAEAFSTKPFGALLTGSMNFGFNTGGATAGNTSATSSLILYELLPSSGTSGTAIDLGTLTLTSTALTFTAFTAIPEPSTYAAVLGALTVGFVMIRRKMKSAAFGLIG